MCQLKSNEMLIGVSNMKALRSSSIVCLVGKLLKLDFNSSLHMRKRHVLNVVHSDIYGSIEVPNYGGNKCFITFFDELSKMLWLYIIKLKSDTLEVFKEFKGLIEKQS